MFPFAFWNSEDDGDEFGGAARVYSHILPARRAVKAGLGIISETENILYEWWGFRWSDGSQPYGMTCETSAHLPTAPSNG